jgi:hypothetical protein
VRYVQADESPHVEYLRTALSELRSRTLRRVDGGTVGGREVVDRALHRILHAITRTRPRDQRDDVRANLAEDMKAAADPAGLLEAFDALESAWSPPERTGFAAGAA